MLVIDSNLIILLIVIMWCVVIVTNKYIIKNIVRRKKRGVYRKMPTEMIKEFIGKECTITLFSESLGVHGTIIALEENWIKVEEKKNIRIINGDVIRDISTRK